MSVGTIHERVRDIQREKKAVCSCDVKQVDEDKCVSSFVNALDWRTNQQQKRTTITALAKYTQGFVCTPYSTRNRLFCPAFNASSWNGVFTDATRTK